MYVSKRLGQGVERIAEEALLFSLVCVLCLLDFWISVCINECNT